MKKVIFPILLLILSQFAVCAQHDTTIIIGNAPVDILFPNIHVRGTILVLPGWNFNRTDICIKSGFCSEALKNGYILVLPDMMKSVYATAIFQETRIDWKRYPTLKWVTDTLIPFCRKQFHIFNPGGKNFLYGISTGARGVALVAENTDNIFLAGAALSGDYDQTNMLSDRLMIGFYGSYSKFKDRWEGPDNPAFHSDKLKIPLYLAHGKQDVVVPCQQSIDFSKKIISEKPERGHQLQLCDTCGHNWDFWNSQTENVFRFFMQNRKKNPGK
jgi:S-formylglutathione hydrolase FrmB